MSLTSAFFAQLEFLHTVCKNLENRFEVADSTVESVTADILAKNTCMLSAGMAVVLAKVRRDIQWFSVYIPHGEITPDNYAACLATVTSRYYQEKAVDGIRALMRGVRHAQYFVHRRSTRVPPMTGVELVKSLYEERSYFMRWQAEQFLDVATCSEEALELDRVVEGINACDFSWELYASLPRPTPNCATPPIPRSPRDPEDEDWDLPPTRQLQPLP